MFRQMQIELQHFMEEKILNISGLQDKNWNKAQEEGNKTALISKLEMYTCMYIYTPNNAVVF